MIDLGESIYLDSYRIFPINDYLNTVPNSFRMYASDNGIHLLIVHGLC
jgi:hypothetical protein